MTQEKKYKRRVLLTLFVNENHDKNTEYLSTTISDAFANPLVQTGNFTVLNRQSVERYMATMGITVRDLHKTENAVRLGKAVGADVIVVGRYITEGQRVTIEARAIDVQAGRLSVEDTAVVRTNSLMFDAINELARKMSAPMAEKMQPMETPPPPAEAVRERVEAAQQAAKEKPDEAKPVEKPKPKLELTLHMGASLALGLGYTRSVYPLGFGGYLAADIAGLAQFIFYRDWLQPITLGIWGGFHFYPTKNSLYENLTQIPVHGYLGYRFTIPWLSDLTVMPFASAGMHFGRFQNINGTASYRLFGFATGARAEYAIGEKLLVGYTVLVLFESDQGWNYSLVNMLSVGVRW